MASIALLISLFPALGHTQNNTSEYLDSDKVGWVSAPKGRGTSSILWSCFAVFLICTWKCTHLNLPSAMESEAGWYTTANGWLPYWPTREYRGLVLRKIKWMCIMAIAPEFGVAYAAQDFWRARRLRNKVNYPGFTLTHAFYAIMGGFVITLPSHGRSENEDPPNSTGQVLGDGSVRQEWVGRRLPEKFESYQPKCIDSESISEVSSTSGEYEMTDDIANGDRILERQIFRSITGSLENHLCLPYVTEEDINNQSNSDPITKAFAGLQCLWMVIQSITRASQGLPLTELELTTLAFIPCAFFMHAFWWYKPFDPQRPIRLWCRDAQMVVKIRASLEPWNVFTRNFNANESVLGDIVMGFFNPSSSWQVTKTFILFQTTALAFSGIHLIAWNWEFPSQIVRSLWRIFAVVTTCMPLAVLLMTGTLYTVLRAKMTDKMERKVKGLSSKAFWLIIVSITVARAALIVLIFYCFSAMPPSVYESPDWNLVFPHFS